ncbi:DUF6603 domain-containing protein [Chitinophaga sp. sic0106]|uniref:DUF6603 domain-containing protein n=1 Tax=Chitinophaga sp. sic0106 TaxID=2854785 RepID=UPI001C4933CE|nr:DUF6603 domain-containing protein [Chitinophaga sp. sic0106]MBV7530484.1 hypothetical protein [Chitinophaga sp. sic0106]
MSINDLVAQLRKQAATGSITLDNTILSNAQITAIQTAYGLDTASFIKINGISVADIPDPNNNNSVTINNGSCDLLNQTNINVQELTFNVNGAVDFILNIKMKDSWQWTDSFPILNVFPFNQIRCSATYFIYSTKVVGTYQLWSANAADAIPLAAGLNIGTRLSLQALSKLPAIFGSLTLDVNGAGPIVHNNSYPYPVMKLSTDLLSSFTLFDGLPVSNLQYIVEITAPQQLVQDIISAVSTTAGDMQLLLDIDQSTEVLRIEGNALNDNYTLANIASGTVAQAILPAGTNFQQFIPSTIGQVFDSISLKGFNITASLGTPKSINRVIFTIGQKSNTRVNLGVFNLTNFVLNVAWTNPKNGNTSTTVKFLASGTIPLKTFNDPLNFSIIAAYNGTWNIQQIEADYPGTIALADIIHEIDSGTKIPDELSGLTFSNFLLQGDVAGSEYTLALQAYWDLVVMSETVCSNYVLNLHYDGSKTDYELKAGFVIGESSITADIIFDQQFKFSGEADDISLSDLLTSLFGNLGIDLTGIPDILLNSLKINYNTPADGQMSINADLTYGNNFDGKFDLVAMKSGNPATWEYIAYAGIGVTNAIDLGALLPMVGPELKGKFEINDAFFIITSKTIDGLTLNEIQGNTLKPGISIGFNVVIDGTPQQLLMQILNYEQQSAGNFYITQHGKLIKSNADASNDNTTGNVHSFLIQKQIGPILIKSIGIKYENFVVSAVINASMTVGPISASLDGLSAGISLKDYTPVFGLNGLSIAYATPALTIEGALIRLPDNQLGHDIKFQFDGVLIVEAEGFGLSALGSYAQMTDGNPSLFIFVDVNAVLGGPPPLIFTGLMGGFGINRNLLLPGFDEVSDFPLMAIGAPQSGSPKDIAIHTLQILEGEQPNLSGHTKVWIPPKSGDYWLAAGVKFSIAEIVNGELMLAAAFGHQLQFAVLGLAWLSLPQGESTSNAFVFVELQISAVFQPLDGYFGVAASLTRNSFVLTKDCHLTGGFAFNLWFGSNPNAGQFVVTAGGYHPAFSIPDYYPKVQRLGYSWRVSSDVSITGGSYFAITPSCAMGGGSLEVLFQAGPVKAWFTAQADLLVAWHPFSFTATMRIELGASVKISVWFVHKTVTVHIGADLDLWGVPLGGKVKVHVVVVTITIHFGSGGASDPNTQPLEWQGLKKMLPAPSDIIKVVATSGLTSTLRRDGGKIIYNDQTASQNATTIWMVRSGTFTFNTQSVIPASSLQCSKSGGNVNSSNINIRPMNKKGVNAVHQVKITKDNAEIDVSTWTFTPIKDKLVANLWGAPLEDSKGNFVQRPSRPSADLVTDLLTGYSITGPSAVPGSSFGVIQMATLQKEWIPKDKNPQNPLNRSNPTNADYLPTSSNTTISDIGNIAGELAASRNNIYNILQQHSIYAGSNDPMNDMAANANNLFTSIPMEIA